MGSHYLGNNKEEGLKIWNDKALELDPRCAWAWNNKIIALNRLRRYNEASESAINHQSYIELLFQIGKELVNIRKRRLK